VWRVAIASLTDLARINTLQDQVPTLDFWTDPRIGRHGVDIRVSSTKGAQEALAAYLSKFSLSYDVFIPDVQHAIEKQLLPPVVAAPHLNSLGDHQSLLSADADPTKTYFTKYHPISEINEYLDYLVKEYPHLAEKFSLGKTYEGRDQWGIKLRAPRNEVSSITKEKKEFVFFGGHHAR
ncbi:Multifunctional pyrimidine synthesis protein CAD, partial [Rhizoclosmatium hyalinum]